MIIAIISILILIVIVFIMGATPSMIVFIMAILRIMHKWAT